MPHRDPSGPLSTFDPSTDTLDQFPLKKPFTGVNDPSSLELADDWNRMFDAASRIQTSLRATGGGSINTFGSGDAEPTASNVTLAFARATATAASGSAVATSALLQVPAIFGTDPFLNPRFAIAPTLYRTAGSEDTQGVWKAGGESDADGRLNELMAMPQHLLAVYPENSDATGRGFRARVRTVPMFANGVADSFARPGERDGSRENIGSSWNLDDTLWDATRVHGWPIHCAYADRWELGPRWYLTMSSEISNNSQAGYALAKMSSSADMEIEFDFLGASSINVESGERTNAVGFAVRMSDDGTGFYGLLFGDQARNTPSAGLGYYSAKLVVASGLDYHDGTSGAGSPIDGSTLTALGSGMILYPMNRYRLRIVGTSLTVWTNGMTGGGDWTLVQTVVATGLSAGKCGLFALAKDDASCRTHWFGNAVAQSIGTGHLGQAFSVALLFAMAGEEEGVWQGPDQSGGRAPIAIHEYSPSSQYDGLRRGFRYAMSDEPQVYTGLGDPWGVLLYDDTDPGTNVPRVGSVILEAGQFGGTLDLSQAGSVIVPYYSTGGSTVVPAASGVRLGLSASASAATEADFVWPTSVSFEPVSGDPGMYTMTWDVSGLPDSVLGSVRSIYLEGTVLQSAAGGLLFGPLTFQR